MKLTGKQSKLIAKQGDKSLKIDIEINNNKPLIIMDDYVYKNSIIITNDEITTNPIVGMDIVYTDPLDDENIITKLATIQNFKTSGVTDLIYCSKTKLLVLIPNLTEMIKLDLRRISVYGTSVAGDEENVKMVVETPNITRPHSHEHNTISLKTKNNKGEDLTNKISIDQSVNIISGAESNNSKNPSQATIYYSSGKGELAISDNTAVNVIRLKVKTAKNKKSEVFTEDSYPLYVMGQIDLDRYKIYSHKTEVPEYLYIILG